MIISHSKKFIFIKTRKTAGTSIENFLVPYLDTKTDICTGSIRAGVPLINHPMTITGHCSWRDIADLITKKQWDSYFKFAIERNPFEKVVSDYRFKVRTTQYKKSWSDYLTEWVESGRMSDWGRYTHEYNPICNVGRYEYLDEFMEGICAQLEIPYTEWQTSEKKYVTPGDLDHYSSWYENQKQVDIVSDAFQNEFLYFGWTFDPRQAKWMEEEFNRMMNQ